MSLCYGINNFLLVVMFYVRFVRMVVPDYCLQPLNKNDCGLKPTAVVTYWKPGSRCEIEVWRGCPTVNKFRDEYHCSNTCIFHSHKPQARTQMDAEQKDECKEVMNDNNCADFKQEVYTYKDGLCVPTIWRGCPTLNKFINSTVCDKSCTNNWFQKLENLNFGDHETINEILDDIIDDSNGKPESRDSIGDKIEKQSHSTDVQIEKEIMYHINENSEFIGSNVDASGKQTDSTSIETANSDDEEPNKEPEVAQDENSTNEPTEIRQPIGVARPRPSVFIDPRYKHNDK